MRKVIDSVVTYILMIIILIISLGTIYFCLDVFGIIEVPVKYSIASIFYSQIEFIANGESIADDVIDIERPKRKVVVDVPRSNSSEEDDYIVASPIEELNRLQAERKEEINKTDSANNFYYNQLDEYGKKIYDLLYQNIDRLKTGTYTADYDTAFNDLLHQDNGTEILNNSFQLAINALTFDNPELFYIDVTKMYLLTERTTRAFSKTYRVSIGGNGNSYLADEFVNRNSVNIAVENIEKIKEDLIVSISDYSTVDKIKAVHDFLADKIVYDASAGDNIYNIYGALINNKAVCEGYARACKYILDDLDIPCIIACGAAKNNGGKTESHAWNYIFIDNAWYALDITWDDPFVIDGLGSNDSIRYSYFLKGSNEFFRDHEEDGNIVGESNFQYPALSALNYNY